MLTYKQALTYLLLNYVAVYATRWINLFAFDGKLSSLGLGVVAALVILSAYPLLALLRRSSWVRVGSFQSWMLIALAFGVFTFLIYAGAEMVTRYYSPS